MSVAETPFGDCYLNRKNLIAHQKYQERATIYQLHDILRGFEIVLLTGRISTMRGRRWPNRGARRSLFQGSAIARFLFETQGHSYTS